MMLTRKMRNLPITAVRFIRAVKYLFAEHIKVPHDVESQQVIAIHQDISKPLLGATELKEGSGLSLNFIQKLVRSMAGLRVHELHPWLLSSAYIFVYFVISRHENDNICMEVYDSMLKGETPNSEVIAYVVNNIIFRCGNLNVTNNKNCEGLTQNQIYNFRRALQKDRCQNELQVLMAWPEDLGLICSSNDRGNMEIEMLHYFKLFEMNYYSSANVVDKLHYLENKDTEESSVNNFSNSIEDNSNSTSLKQSKNIDNKLENCSLEDENQVNNITKRILRPRINANNELHKKDEIEGRITRSKNKIILINSDVADKELKDYSKKVVESNDVKENEFSCRQSLVSSNHNEELQSVSTAKALFNANADISITDSSNITKCLNNEVTCLNNENVRAEVNFIVALSKKNIKPEPVSQDAKEKADIVKSDINDNTSCSLNSSTKKEEVSINLKNANVKSNNIASNNEFHVVSIKDISKYQSIQSFIENCCMAKSYDSPNKNKFPNTSGTSPDLIIRIQVEKVTNSEISNEIDKVKQKNSNKIQDILEKNENKIINPVTDSVFNENKTCIVNENGRAEVNFISELSNKNIKPEAISQDSKEKADTLSNDIDTNPASSKDINRKSSKRYDNKSHGIAWIKNMTSLWEKEHITLIGSTDATTPKNLAPTTAMGNKKRGHHSDADQASQANQNNLGQDSQIEKKTIKNSFKFNSSAMDSPVFTVTSKRNFTASNNNSGSILKREPITVVDLDFEPTVLNLKRKNQSPQELQTVKKMCFESRPNSCANDCLIPFATTSNLTTSNNNSDSTLKRKSITVVDLDLEPCMLNLNAMSQSLQDPPNVKTIRLDATFKSPAMDIPITVSTTNSSFTADYKDSNSYMKEITTKVETPELEIIEIRKKNTFGRSISRLKMSSNTASMPTLTPGPLAILFANRDLSKYSKEKTAAVIDKTIPWTNGSPSSQKQSQPRQNTVDNFSRRSTPMDWQSKKALMNEPVNSLILKTEQKVKPNSQASLTEMNGVNPVDQDNPLLSQQCPLQDHEVNDNTSSSSFKNDSSKFQSNIQQNTDTTNVGGNFSVQAGPLPLNPRLTSSTVSDRPCTIQLAEKNKIGSAYQEDILQPTLNTDMSTVGDKFPLNQADEEYSNTSSVKPQLLTKVRITPLQQPNFQFNGTRYPTHCSNVQHYNLVNNTSILLNCLPAQQQPQSMRYVSNSATANSTAAVARHGVNEVLTPVSKVRQANLDNLHYFCDYCPIQLKFASAELLYQHVNDAHNYSCQLCQNRYPTRQALYQHIDEHRKHLGETSNSGTW